MDLHETMMIEVILTVCVLPNKCHTEDRVKEKCQESICSREDLKKSLL